MSDAINRTTTILEPEVKGFRWHGNGHCKVRGCFFDGKGVLHTGKSMVDYFSGARDYGSFTRLVQQANGVFSVIFSKEGETWLATDLVRSLPLFFVRSEFGWTVADNADSLMNARKARKRNEVAWLEFRGTGYVTGSDTLIEGIYQVPAGAVIRLIENDPSGYQHEYHHSYQTNVSADPDQRKFHSLGKEKIIGTFARMIESLEGRTVVVPLSGGFDSRLIAVMLKRLGYEKVICMTYGRGGNAEAALSEQVAKKLDFPWYFMEYTEELIKGFVEDKEFRDYYPYGSNLASMFFLQEFFAVRALRDRGIVPEDAVYVPGHSGDFLGGSQFAKHQLPLGQETPEALAERILEVKYHFETYDRSERTILLDRILGRLQEKGTEPARSYSVHEDWDLKEKFAKFNVNSTSIYSFFGHAFRLPFFDRDLVNFFRDLPVEYKKDKSLYDNILNEEFFQPAGVRFERELHTSRRAYKISRLRNRIKKRIPARLLSYRRQKADVLFYREITGLLREDMLRKGGSPPVYGNKYNKMIIDWYLFTLQEKISK